MPTYLFIDHGGVLDGEVSFEATTHEDLVLDDIDLGEGEKAKQVLKKGVLLVKQLTELTQEYDYILVFHSKNTQQNQEEMLQKLQKACQVKGLIFPPITAMAVYDRERYAKSTPDNPDVSVVYQTTLIAGYGQGELDGKSCVRKAITKALNIQLDKNQQVILDDGPSVMEQAKKEGYQGFLIGNPPDALPLYQAIDIIYKQALAARPPLKPWQTFTKLPKINLDANGLIAKSEYTQLQAAEPDIQRVVNYYQANPVLTHDIKNVYVTYNPVIEQRFILQLLMLQARDGNNAFAARWALEAKNNDEKLHRQTVLSLFNEKAYPASDSSYPGVKLIPLWHGTDASAVDSLLHTGYVNLATTDKGFFGRGIYGTPDAEYAHRVYSKGKGALLINWGVVFSVYPVMKGDEKKLVGAANYQNYDAHFIPVIPRDPKKTNEVNYDACTTEQLHTYTELVIFDSAACLPRYRVELTKREPHKEMPITAGELAYQTGERCNQEKQPLLAFYYFSKAKRQGYAPADERRTALLTKNPSFTHLFKK